MKYYITTPIYYVNDAPHIGHAYTSVMADIFARKMRESGEVFFLTGTDEHGQKIERSAASKGMNTFDFCDEVSAKFKALMTDFDISNNDFIRTTEDRHIKGVQAFWLKLKENGWIYKGKYEGWYAVRDEAFYSEEELVNGKAPTGAEVEWQVEESYFFKLSAFTDVLLAVYKEIPSVVFPSSRLNEVKAFVSGGLKDLSISRTSFKWGIPVPNDENHVIYVWLDALTNYVTALGYGSKDDSKYKEFWLSNAKKIHFIGKDILRFHAIFWPAFLIAERYKFEEIKMTEVLDFFKNFRVISHGWWKNNGEKMSKSLGNAISCEYLLENFGLDRVRYYFARSLVFGSDGDFSDKHFKETVNADLANNVGNLTQRVISFIYMNCNGEIPPLSGNRAILEIFPEVDFTSNLEVANKLLEGFLFQEVIEEVLLLGRKANERVDRSAPWVLKKEGKIEEMNDVLHLLSIVIYNIYKQLECVMPESSVKGLAIFNGEKPRAGLKINKPEPIFTRL
jgi:methionyl-tRNA synthetase